MSNTPISTRHFHSFAIMKLSEPPHRPGIGGAFASSGLTTTSAWPLFGIRSRRVPTLQTGMHCLAADHHHCRGFLIGVGLVGLRGAAQICLPGGDGGDHNDGANAKDPGHQLKVTSHEISQRVAGGKLVAKLHEDATKRCYAVEGLTPALFRRRAPSLMNMPQEAIAPLPSDHYWARPHTPFPLDGPNRHDEVFPGAHYVSNGVTSYKNWACMLTAQEDTLPFSPNQTYHPSNQQNFGVRTLC